MNRLRSKAIRACSPSCTKHEEIRIYLNYNSKMANDSSSQLLNRRMDSNTIIIFIHLKYLIVNCTLVTASRETGRVFGPTSSVREAGNGFEATSAGNVRR